MMKEERCGHPVLNWNLPLSQLATYINGRLDKCMSLCLCERVMNSRVPHTLDVSPAIG